MNRKISKRLMEADLELFTWINGYKCADDDDDDKTSSRRG
nr:8953_t:CDS:2 [Entrophospora candida]